MNQGIGYLTKLHQGRMNKRGIMFIKKKHGTVFSTLISDKSLTSLSLTYKVFNGYS